MEARDKLLRGLVGRIEALESGRRTQEEQDMMIFWCREEEAQDGQQFSVLAGGQVDSVDKFHAQTADEMAEAGAIVNETLKPNTMFWLRISLISLSWAPAILFQAIGTHWLNYAPAHLMVWAAVPAAAMSFITHWMITVELTEFPGVLEEIHFAGWVFLAFATVSPYWMIKLDSLWWGIGWGAHCAGIYPIGRYVCVLLRTAVRTYHLRAGTLHQLVDR